MPEVIQVEGISNAEFFERYAARGRVGLFGGAKLVNRLISRGQRHIDADGQWSRWSHAFLFEGRRADGHHWLIESDLDFHRKHIRLGAQENRVAKYHADEKTSALAILDFGLTPAQTDRVIAEALEHVATRSKYSLREIAGTAWAMRRAERRERGNPWERERAYFCSAFVRQVLASAGVEVAPGVAVKNTAPEHIARAGVPHTRWELLRGEAPRSRLRKLGEKIKARLDGRRAGRQRA